MSQPWDDAVAGRPVSEGPAAGWAMAVRGALPAAIATLDPSVDRTHAALADTLRAWIDPAAAPASVPRRTPPSDPVEAWALARHAFARGLPLPAPPAVQGDLPATAAEHARLVASQDRSIGATQALRTLARRDDAVGAAAALDLGARTPDRLLATRLLGDGLTRARHLGMRPLAAHALRLLATRATHDGRAAEALPLLTRALKLDRACGALTDELVTRRAMDDALVALHRQEPRLEALEAWLEAARRAQDDALAGWILSAIGHTALATRHDTRARTAFDEAARIARVAQDPVSLAADLAGLARAADRLGDPGAAAAARTEASALRPASTPPGPGR